MDIFAAAGLDKLDISVISDEFLAEVRGMPHRNLAVELLGDSSIAYYEVLSRGRVIHAGGEFITIKDNTGMPSTRYTDDTVKLEKSYVYMVNAEQPRGQTAVKVLSRHVSGRGHN